MSSGGGDGNATAALSGTLSIAVLRLSHEDGGVDPERSPCRACTGSLALPARRVASASAALFTADSCSSSRFSREVSATSSILFKQIPRALASFLGPHGCGITSTIAPTSANLLLESRFTTIASLAFKHIKTNGIFLPLVAFSPPPRTLSTRASTGGGSEYR